MPLQYNNETCSGCKTCQLVCALSKFRTSNPSLAFLNVKGKFPAPGKYDVDYCDQCGKCAEVCPVGAIEQTRSVFDIDPALCIGCKLCIEACPYDVIRFIEGIAHKCNDCGQCAEICPRNALSHLAEGASV